MESITQAAQIAQINFLSFTEEDLGKLKAKDGLELLKVGKVSKDKVSVFIGKACYLPVISMADIAATFGACNPEASSILLEYFTVARSSYIRERIIEGLSSIPATLIDFAHRNLWLAFNGISAEQAGIFAAQVIATRCEEFSFTAAAKKLGFASIEEVPEEKEAELLQVQAQFLPTFIKAASTERNKEFIANLVLEGRILSRYGKFSEAQCAEGLKWIAGVDSPFTQKATDLLNQRVKQIKDQVANIGLLEGELSVMGDYFKL